MTVSQLVNELQKIFLLENREVQKDSETTSQRIFLPKGFRNSVQFWEIEKERASFHG